MVLDSTRIGAFFRCPRFYQFRYEFDWNKEGATLPLIFGQAWHKAKEILVYPDRRDSESVNVAYEEFKKLYFEHFTAEDDNLNLPRNSAGALAGLLTYSKEYPDDDYEVLHVEEVGVVPIKGDDSVSFVMDAVIRGRSGIWVMDTKTSGTDRAIYTEVLNQRLQFDIYIAGASMYYEDVQGLIVDQSVFKKKDRLPSVQHNRIYIRRTWRQIEDTLTSVSDAIDLIKRYRDEGFPKHFNCIAYNRLCDFWDICSTIDNMKDLNPSEPPFGYIIDKWKPEERIKNGDSIK